MKFEDKLKYIRKDRKITQEDLAETLSVSRQAVSKWEQGSGYPETETLIELAKVLDVSLDYLLLQEKETVDTTHIDSKKVYATHGVITIQSFDRKEIVNCICVKSSRILFAGKDDVKYILIGVSRVTFWGEHSSTLGWYDSLESLQQEFKGIMEAIDQKSTTYSLKYYADIELAGIFGQPRIKKPKD